MLLCLILILSNLYLFGQEKSKRLTFILSIDGELPVSDIKDGFFMSGDSLGCIKDTIPFEYHVGYLSMSPANYKKFFSLNPSSRVFINFLHLLFRPQHFEKIYRKEIPREWLNEEYIILKVYNVSNKESRAKYYFKPEEQSLIQIIIPGNSTILTTRTK